MSLGRVQLVIAVTIQNMELIKVVIKWHHVIDFSEVFTVC